MARDKKIKLGLLERAIYSVSPDWALRRHKARAAMAVSGYVGGYTGGQYADRFAYWTPGYGDADANIVRDLRDLRARSRDLVRNSPIAGGAIETQVTHVVGTGLTLQSRIDADFLGMSDDEASAWQSNAEREFALWAESIFADVSEDQCFYELQDLVYRSRLESGDVFVLLSQINRPDWPYRLSLQVIEADRVSNPDWSADLDTMVQGIERTEAGTPVAVYVTNRHPGRQYATKQIKWTRIPIRGASGRLNVLHLSRKLRPGQTRGIPELAPIVALLKQLDRFATAEVDAAVNSAAMAVFVKMDPNTFQDVFDDAAQTGLIEQAKQWDGSIGSGKAINLLPGESIEAPTPGRPNPQFDPFFGAVLKQVGIGLGMPYEVLAKHFQSSYSAARAALLDAWRTFRIRREWLASRFCQPVYEEWLAEAVSAGRIEAPGFFSDAAVRKAWCGAKWSGDGPGAIDPLKEAEAAGKRMELGITTLAEEVVAYDGGDWEQKHRQRTREVEERVEAGLEAPVTAAPGDAAMPAPENDADPGENVDPTEDPMDSKLAAALVALASRDAPAVNVGVHLPQGLELSIPAPVVNVAAPEVRVDVAAPTVNVEAPSVNVEAVMPEQKAPIVIERAAAKAAAIGHRVVRDAEGKITGIEPVAD